MVSRLHVSGQFMVFIRLFFKIPLLILPLFLKSNVGIHLSEVIVKGTTLHTRSTSNHY